MKLPRYGLGAFPPGRAGVLMVTPEHQQVGFTLNSGRKLSSLKESAKCHKRTWQDSVGPRPIASRALPASDRPTQIVANWCTYGAIKPSRIASTTAWMRFLAPSFFIALSMCHSTVRLEM